MTSSMPDEGTWLREFGFSESAVEQADTSENADPDTGDQDLHLWPYDPPTDPDYSIGRSHAEVEGIIDD